MWFATLEPWPRSLRIRQRGRSSCRPIFREWLRVWPFVCINGPRPFAAAFAFAFISMETIALIASRAALDVSAAALAVADAVVAVADAGRAPLPFAWIHDAVADATRDRHVADRALATGLLTVDQHAAKRDAIRVRLRSAVSIANDGDGAPVVVAFPDVAMHDATLTDAGVAFVRVCHATRDGVCGFISGPAFRSRLPFAGAVAAVSHAIDPAAVVRLPGERVAPSGSGRVARAVCLPTIADV